MHLLDRARRDDLRHDLGRRCCPNRALTLPTTASAVDPGDDLVVVDRADHGITMFDRRYQRSWNARPASVDRLHGVGRAGTSQPSG